MPCHYATPLTEDQITAALDGEADKTVRDHLASCPYCASRLEEARKLERMFTQLYRWNCPSSQQLGDYYLNLVADQAAREITQHLTTCTYCQAEIEQLRTFLNTESSSAPVKQPPRGSRAHSRFGEIIAKLLPSTPALALRGSQSGPVVAEAGGGITLFLEVELTGDKVFQLNGQLVADDQVAWSGALFQLFQAGVLQAVAVLSDDGNFSCKIRSIGHSDVHITAQDGRVVILSAVNLVV